MNGLQPEPLESPEPLPLTTVVPFPLWMDAGGFGDVTNVTKSDESSGLVRVWADERDERPIGLVISSRHRTVLASFWSGEGCRGGGDEK
jgi:hypothetical protein